MEKSDAPDKKKKKQQKTLAEHDYREWRKTGQNDTRIKSGLSVSYVVLYIFLMFSSI